MASRSFTPRNFLKRIALTLVAGDEASFKAALRSAMTNPRTVLQFTELVMRLNKEIGSHAEPAAGTSVIKLITNVDPPRSCGGDSDRAQAAGGYGSERRGRTCLSCSRLELDKRPHRTPQATIFHLVNRQPHCMPKSPQNPHVRFLEIAFAAPAGSL